jgi:hypothetical protein
VFLESRDPTFIPMADVEVLSAMGEPVARYDFALLHRAMVIAAPPTSKEEPETDEPTEAASLGDSEPEIDPSRAG